MKNFELWDDKPKLIAEKRKEWFQGIPKRQKVLVFFQVFNQTNPAFLVKWFGLLLLWIRSKLTNLPILEIFLTIISTRFINHPAQFHLQHISQLHMSPGGVLDVLHHLDVSKATGPDKIPAKLLRKTVHRVFPTPFVQSSIKVFT